MTLFSPEIPQDEIQPPQHTNAHMNLVNTEQGGVNETRRRGDHRKKEGSGSGCRSKIRKMVKKEKLVENVWGELLAG